MITTEELLSYYVGGMSEYQKDHFVTKKNGGTLWGMFRQALRELKTRDDVIIGLELDIDEALLDIDEIVHDRNKGSKRDSLVIKRSNHKLKNLRHKLSETRVDYEQFKKQAEFCYNQLKETGIDIDSVEGRYGLDELDWQYRTVERLHLDFIAMGGPSRETLGLMLSLSERSRKPIENLLKIHTDRSKIIVELERQMKSLQYIPDSNLEQLEWNI